MRHFLKLFCSTLLLICSFSAQAQSNSNNSAQPPQEFEAYIRAHLQQKMFVRMEGEGRLAYYFAPPETQDVLSVEPIYITPTPEQWTTFYASLDEHNIWDWEESYVPEQAVFDSVSWGLKVKHGKKHVNSHGYGAAPDGYAYFTNAVSNLIGHKFE